MSKTTKFQIHQAENDALVALANGLPASGAVRPAHDVIELANAAAFADTYFSEPLTAYLVLTSSVSYIKGRTCVCFATIGAFHYISSVSVA